VEAPAPAPVRETATSPPAGDDGAPPADDEAPPAGGDARFGRLRGLLDARAAAADATTRRGGTRACG